MQNIGTSINIERTYLDRVQSAARQLNICEQELLSLLVQKSRLLLGNKAVTGHAVKYQHDSCSAEYVIHHVNLFAVDYEFMTGRRYLFKISVSFLFRLAIVCFLDEILYDWTKEKARSTAERRKYTTNSHYTSYDIAHLLDVSSEFWVIPWPRE